MKKFKAFLVIMIAVLCMCSTVFAKRVPTIRDGIGALEEEFFYVWNEDPDNIDCYKQAYDKVMEAIKKNPAEYSDAISLAGTSWMDAYSNEIDKFEEYSELLDKVLDSILCLPAYGADSLAEATLDFFWMLSGDEEVRTYQIKAYDKYAEYFKNSESQNYEALARMSFAFFAAVEENSSDVNKLLSLLDEVVGYIEEGEGDSTIDIAKMADAMFIYYPFDSDENEYCIMQKIEDCASQINGGLDGYSAGISRLAIDTIGALAYGDDYDFIDLMFYDVFDDLIDVTDEDKIEALGTICGALITGNDGGNFNDDIENIYENAFEEICNIDDEQGLLIADVAGLYMGSYKTINEEYLDDVDELYDCIISLIKDTESYCDVSNIADFCMATMRNGINQPKNALEYKDLIQYYMNIIKEHMDYEESISELIYELMCSICDKPATSGDAKAAFGSIVSKMVSKDFSYADALAELGCLRIDEAIGDESGEALEFCDEIVDAILDNDTYYANSIVRIGSIALSAFLDAEDLTLFDDYEELFNKLIAESISGDELGFPDCTDDMTEYFFTALKDNTDKIDEYVEIFKRISESINGIEYSDHAGAFEKVACQAANACVKNPDLIDRILDMLDDMIAILADDDYGEYENYANCGTIVFSIVAEYPDLIEEVYAEYCQYVDNMQNPIIDFTVDEEHYIYEFTKPGGKLREMPELPSGEIVYVYWQNEEREEIDIDTAFVEDSEVKAVRYPVAIIEETGNFYDSIEDALVSASAMNGSTILVMQDCTVGRLDIQYPGVTFKSYDKTVTIKVTAPILLGYTNTSYEYTFTGSGDCELILEVSGDDGENTFRPIALRNGNTLNIEDGVIIKGSNFVGSSAANSFGGMIYVMRDATLNINGGTIKDSKTNQGGAIFLAGTLNMNGGTIENCEAVCEGEDDSTSGRGGAILVNIYGELNMNGGTIKDCTAAIAGGAVYSYNKVNLSGDTSIEDCKAEGDAASTKGGAIYMMASSELNMNGGSITGCSADKGAAVYMADGTMASITSGEIENNEASENGGGVFIHSGDSSVLNISGNPSIINNNVDGTNNNVYLGEGTQVTIDGDLSGNNKVGITTEKVSGDTIVAYKENAENFTSDELGHFVSDNGNYKFEASGDKILLKENKNPGGTSGGSSTPSYKITITQGEGGKISPKTAYVTKGRDQKFTITPNDGYEIEDVIVDGESVGAVEEYTFEKVKEKHTIEAIFTEVDNDEDWENPFVDVKENDWFYDAVEYANLNDLFKGVTDNTFEPNTKITRAMVVTVLWRLDGQKYPNYYMRFKDVESGKWYTEAIRWAASEKIVTGYDEETFGPNDVITREQFATILYRYAKSKGQGFQGSWMFLLQFTDRNEVSDWAYEAVCWCTMKGIITGRTDGTFDPKATATRAEAAAMMMRYNEI